MTRAARRGLDLYELLLSNPTHATARVLAPSAPRSLRRIAEVSALVTRARSAAHGMADARHRSMPSPESAQNAAAPQMTPWAARIERAAGGPQPTLLDRWMPTYDVSESRHVIVRASPDQTYQALHRIDFAEPAWVRAVTTLYMWLRKANEVFGGPPAPELPERIGIGDLETLGRVRLGEEPGREIAFGAVGELWNPMADLERITAEQLADYRRPGKAKAVASFAVRPYDDARTLVSYELRALGTDADSSGRLVRFFRLVRPLVRAMMGSVLERVKREAESAAKAGDATKVTIP